MQQEISYCSGAGGTRLAVASIGSGPPVVMAGAWLTHLEHDLQNPAQRHWLHALARGRRLVRYDARGNGLSQRDVERVDFEAWVEDLECIVDTYGLERFALFGLSQGATMAVAYAARHPARVSHLALYGPCVRGLMKRNPPPKVVAAAQALLQAAHTGWGVDSSAFRKMFLHGLVREATPEQLALMDEGQRHTVSADVAVKFLQAAYELDVSGEAPGVRCPTLIVHADQDPCFPFSEASLLASLIPGARLVQVASRNHLLMEQEPAWAAAREALDAFLPSDATAAPSPLTVRQTEVLMHVASGRTDKEIGRLLGLSPRTVEMHVAHALQALACHNRTEAVHRAGELGLLRRAPTGPYSSRAEPLP